MEKKHTASLFFLIFLCLIPQGIAIAGAPLVPKLVISSQGTKVLISWNAMPEADSFTLYYAPYPDMSYVDNMNMGDKTDLNINLWDEASFYVAVTANNQDGNSLSDIESFTLWSSVSAFIEKTPESYSNSLSTQTLSLYKKLLLPLPTDVKKWVVGMGWGLEDLSLDGNEISLLESLPDKNKSTMLSILTHPDIIDGVSQADLKWAEQYLISDLNDKLKEDIEKLKGNNIINDSALNGLNELLSKAETNSEMAKAFHLISNFGIPNPTPFSYPVPSFNTQLYILGKFIEFGIPNGYEVAALAAALDYGSLYSIADDALRTLIPKYAYDMIIYQKETAQILNAYNVDSTDNLPLEAQINLVWGAPGNYFPIENISYSPKWDGYRKAFIDQPMSVKDFEFVFVAIDTLESIRNYILNNGLWTNDIEAFSSNITQFWYGDHLDYQYTHSLINIDDKMIPNSYICNMDWQWDTFLSNGQFIGTSGDGYIHTYMLKSVNRAGLTPTYLTHISGYYDPSNQIWKADSIELNNYNYSDIDSKIGWNMVPFDNFWFNPSPETIAGTLQGRITFLIPLNNILVWDTGVPAGYIFRSVFAMDGYP